MGYLRIAPQQEKALRVIAGVATDRFAAISKSLTDQSKPSIRASGLLKAVKGLSDDEDFALALCSQMISLGTFRRVEKLAADDVFELLYEGMKVAEFSDENLKWFETSRLSFVNLLDSDCIRLPAKALFLSTDFEQLYTSASVVTDVRPVFDGERTDLAGAIVTQTLQVRYVGGSGKSEEKQVSLALDIDDIDKLIAELEKAKQKAQSAKERFGSATDTEIFVIGEETYGFS